ncbi:hypothetical protein [uncultured Brachyspira sp.]|uniref:hypothetical protein n=1 Tax=uncultured Brachyspira sp. TaxID=221953 RepID=UPI0027DD2942|nr:hypothetical protein [uncultured Brachyspira sp.]
MKHTKNILKSLLITVMALSLLAVSCSKDEGGSKPTNPTSITITADNINSFLTSLKGEGVAVGSIATILTTETIDVSKKQDIAVSAKAVGDTAQNISKTDFAAALEGVVSSLSSDVTITVDTSAIVSASSTNPANCVLNIKPSGQNKFDTTVTGIKNSYTETDGLKITLKITPDKPWQ